MAAVVVTGCKGESALFARDAGASSGVGGAGLVAGSGGMGDAGKGGAGMAGQAGSAQTGGVGGSGNKGGAGGGAGGAGGQGGGAGSAAGAGGGGGQPAGMFGDRCQSSGDCKQGTCKSGFCCTVDCSGTCQTCDGTGAACTDVAFQQDPRNDCPATAKSMCGASGMGCDGNGACILWPAATVCSSASTCSGTGAVVQGSVCDGQGHCNANAPVSCNGFLCQSNACLKSCTDGTACVTGGFCGAGTCVGPTPNLAGNGDLEYGTTDGWAAIPNGAGLSATSTVMNGGMYSAQQTSRANFYIGPGYYIPTGLGIYHISLWAMQNQVTGASLPRGLLQLRLNCAQGMYYYAGNVEVPGMPSGTWVNFTATIDTTMDQNVKSDCFAKPTLQGAVPGLVRSAVVLFDEDMSDSPVAGKTSFPDFYVDDLVVTANDVPNLVGNPNFEAPGGFVDGWSTNALDVKGTATLSVSTTQHNGNSGTNSLWAKNRSLWNVGIRYALPIGAADYAVTFYVMQSGVTAHRLQLWAAYSCLGDPPNTVRQKAIAQTASALPTGMWTALSSAAVAFPPSDAPKTGCKMTGAAFWVTQVEQGPCGTGTGQVECPHLFLDDAIIAITNTPPTD